MICRVRSTRRSPRGKPRSCQSGRGRTWAASQLQMSAQMVGSALGSMSSEVTSHPSSAKARPIEPVPEKSSSKRRIVSTVVFHVGLAGQPDDRDQGGAAAGQLKVAQGHLPPAERPRGRQVLVEEAGVAPPQGRG